MYYLNLADACYFHLALVENMLAVFTLNLCNCTSVMKCDLTVSANAGFNGII